MTLLDGAIVIVFLLYSTYAGFSSKDQASRNLEEYFLAGRSLKGWQAGLSMAATQFASDTPLLVTGLIATAGVFALWQMWIYALSFLLMGFVLAPCWRRSSVLTDAELTELRYGHRRATVLRGIKAVYFGTIFNCTVLAWVFFAATKIAEPFLLWQDWLPPAAFEPIRRMVQGAGIPLTLTAGLEDAAIWTLSASNFISVFAIVLVTFVYSTTGGLRAVVKTDVVQLLIMLGATAIYMLFVIHRAGGMDAIISAVHEKLAHGGPGGILPEQILAFTPDQAKGVTFPLLAVFALQWLIQLNSDGTGYLAQRSMACRSEHDAKIAALVFSVTQILLRSLLWLPIALGLLILFPHDPSLPAGTVQAAREATFVLGMNELLPAGFKGIMLTGMLAALASTVDTHLNWGASYWTNDIYKRIVCEVWMKKNPSPRSLVWIARGSNLLILLIALAVGTQLTSINAAWQISLLLGAGVGVVLILRWLWWRMSSWGEIFALGTSLVCAPLAFFFIDDQALRLLTVAFFSTAAAIAAVFILGPEEEERLIAFYRKVRPPGFWGVVAEKVEPGAAGRAKRHLFRMLAATALCALSLFSLLTAIGSWLIESPAPRFFPWHGPWIFLLTVVGSGLIPVWWKLGFSEAEKSH